MMQTYSRDDQTTQRGLSLLELMVSLALSSVLIIGIFTLYIDSTQTHQFGAALSRTQEAGRLAHKIMSRDFRMAGYQGCADPDDVSMNVIAKNAPNVDLSTTALRGFEVTSTNWAAGSDFDNTEIESRAIIGSDVIAIQRGESTNITLTGNMSVDNANIQVTGSDISLFSMDDAVLISDCEHSDLFRITSNPLNGTWTHATSNNTDNRLSTAYHTDAQIFRFRSVVYFVADTGREDLSGDPIYALYRATDTLDDSLALTAAGRFDIEELVDGVESLQILYGQQLPATGNIRFVPAGTAGLNMNEVVSIRLGLLIAGVDAYQQTDDTQTYQLPGQAIPPETDGGNTTHPVDKRIRRTFMATINLRNRD